MSACAGMLCACSSENGVDDVPVTPPTPPEPVEQLPIRISSMPEARALDNAFETGDRIGVFVVNRNANGSAVGLKTQGNYIDNSMYTFMALGPQRCRNTGKTTLRMPTSICIIHTPPR